MTLHSGLDLFADTPTVTSLWEIIVLTLRVSGTALGLSALIGIPAGAALAMTRFSGRRLVIALTYTGMGLPPVVVGLATFMFLSRSSPLGTLGWLFTPAAMILAQTVIALPLVAGLTMAALEAVDPELRLQLRALGADSKQEVQTLLLEAKEGVVAALVAGFGAIVSEVGAAMLVGGNIEGQTRILSTAIILETRRGEFGFALALGGTLLALTFMVNILLLRLRQRPRRVWR